MRVCMVIYGELNHRSGGFLYDSHLCKCLEEHGHQIRVISQKEGPLPLRTAGNFTSIIQKIHHVEPDIVLVDELNHPSLFAVIKKIRRHAPVIAIVHHLRSSENLHLPDALFTSFMERRLLSQVDGMIYNSQFTSDSVNRFLGFKPSASVIVDPAAENVRHPPRRKEAGPSRVLYVGNIVARKKLDVLIQALLNINSAPWTLDVVGSALFDRAYSRKCRKLIPDGDERIRFHGRLSDKKLEELRKQCHLFAMPSGLEGFGIVYLEAMRAGLLPIGGEAGGAAEIISHGRDGYLVSTQEALQKILLDLFNDDEKRLQMAEAAYFRSSQWPDWGSSMDSAVKWLEDWNTPETRKQEQPVRAYYDKNTRRFLRYGQGGTQYTIHRVVKHPTAENPSRFQEECILKLLKKYQINTIIDLGCGVGSSLAWLSALHPGKYAGLTLSPVQTDIAKLILEAGIPVHTGSYLDESSYRLMPAPEGRQLLYGIESWLHCSDPNRLFALLKERTRPGDIVLFWDDFIRNQNNARNNQRLIEDIRSGWHAMNLLTSQEADSIAGKYGFHIIEDKDYSRWLDIDRIRDYLIAASVPFLRIFKLKSPWWQNLLGGNALRTALKTGTLSYRLRVWMRKET